MKVLHIIDTLGRGGAERLLITLLPELARQGHEVAVAVLKGPYDLAPELEAAGVPVIRLPKHHKWNLLAGARSIAKAMPGADVIHAHLYFPAVNTALARIVGLTHASTCVTFHNLAYAGANRDSLGLRLRKRLARALYAHGMQSKMAVSQAVADHYKSTLLLDRVDVLPNPIDLAAVDAAQPTTHTENGHFHIVLPGRLVAEKGHMDLIAALQEPRLFDLPLTITFAGHGKLQEELEAACAKLHHPVTITGTLDHQAFLRMVASADIVVIPSRFEGFGLTALEAMALSKPVIASTAGGLPEVLGNTGYLVPVCDVGALAEAIDVLTADPEARHSMGNAARIRAERKFSLPAIGAKLIKIYEDLDRKSGSGSKADSKTKTP